MRAVLDVWRMIVAPTLPRLEPLILPASLDEALTLRKTRSGAICSPNPDPNPLPTDASSLLSAILVNNTDIFNPPSPEEEEAREQEFDHQAGLLANVGTDADGEEEVEEVYSEDVSFRVPFVNSCSSQLISNF